MNIHDDLAVEWANIAGTGLVRVFPVSDFHRGLALTVQIGVASEQVGYYPEVVLAADKVTVTIPSHDEGLDHHLAHAIDDSLGDAA